MTKHGQLTQLVEEFIDMGDPVYEPQHVLSLPTVTNNIDGFYRLVSQRDEIIKFNEQLVKNVERHKLKKEAVENR